MLSTNTNYDAIAEQSGKQPVYIFSFTGITQKIASGNFVDIDSNYVVAANNVTEDFAGFDIIRNSVTNNTIEFDVFDKDGFFSALMRDNSLTGIDTTISKGFSTLKSTDFITKLHGFVDSVDFNSNYFHVVIRDLFPNTDTPLFLDTGQDVLKYRMSKAYTALTMSSGATAGSSVVVAVTSKPDEDLAPGDFMWIRDNGFPTPTTNEWAEIEDISRTIGAYAVTFKTLSNSYSASATMLTTYIPINDASLFRNPSSAYTAWYTQGYFVKIGSEIIEYDTRDTTYDVLGIAAASSRGYDDTIASSQSAGQVVYDCLHVIYHPIDLLLNILVGTSVATTHGSYDKGVPQWGLKIDNDYIDVTGLEAIKTAHFNSANYLFHVYPYEQEPATNIVLDIMKTLGLNYKISDEGKITFYLIKVPEKINSVYSIGDSNSQGAYDSLSKFDPINLISWDYYYNWGTGAYRTHKEFELSDSRAQYGDSGVLAFRSRGLRAGASNFDSNLRSLLHPIIAIKYGNPSAIGKVNLNSGAGLIEIGDDIDYANTRIKDLTLDKTIAKQCEVIATSVQGFTGITFLMHDYINYAPADYDYDVNQAIMDLNAGNNYTVTKNSDSTALIQSSDGYFDNIGTTNVKATAIDVDIDLSLTGGETIQVKCTICKGVNGAIIGSSTVEVIDSQTDNIAGPTGTHNFYFSGLDRDVYDVKIDYIQDIAGTPTPGVELFFITYHDEGDSYTAI